MTKTNKGNFNTYLSSFAMISTDPEQRVLRDHRSASSMWFKAMSHLNSHGIDKEPTQSSIKLVPWLLKGKRCLTARHTPCPQGRVRAGLEQQLLAAEGTELFSSDALFNKFPYARCWECILDFYSLGLEETRGIKSGGWS